MFPLRSTSPENQCLKLKKLLLNEDIILAPAAYDVLSARIIQHVGFKVVYMSGFGTAASLLGLPDVGLVTMNEMVDNARRIVQAVNIPVIADADTGYGNPINVMRTVQEFERAGVAAIQLEDQVFPKKCGHMTGKQIIDKEEMVEKIKAAKEAQRNKDFIIIARTDAIAVTGINDAIERAKAYYNAGADMLFIEAPENLEQVEKISKELAEYPLVYNWLEGGRSPLLSLEKLKELKFKLVIFPLSTLLAATKAMMSILETIYNEGTPINVLDRIYKFNDFLNFIGLPEVEELEKRFKIREK